LVFVNVLKRETFQLAALAADVVPLVHDIKDSSVRRIAVFCVQRFPELVYVIV
jgi:hypothetical protein